MRHHNIKHILLSCHRIDEGLSHAQAFVIASPIASTEGKDYSDLSGRRILGTPSHGIYIKGGRKFYRQIRSR